MLKECLQAINNVDAALKLGVSPRVILETTTVEKTFSLLRGRLISNTAKRWCPSPLCGPIGDHYGHECLSCSATEGCFYSEYANTLRRIRAKLFVILHRISKDKNMDGSDQLIDALDLGLDDILIPSEGDPWVCFTAGC